MLSLIVLVLAVVTLLVYVVAAGRCFLQHGSATAGLNAVKVTGLFSCIAVIVALALAKEMRTLPALLGSGLFLAGLAIFVWALQTHSGQRLTRIYCDDVPRHLITTGPYGLVRHPCYAAYLLAFTGGLVATLNPWLLPIVATNLGLYVHAAWYEERKFAQSPLAEAHAAYRRRTGMLLPNPFKWFRR